MVIVKERDQHQSLDEINLSFAPFWIQVHNLPPSYMSVENIPLIRNQLGHIINFEDSLFKGVLTRSFLCIRVLLNLSQPLKLGFWLFMSNEECIWIKFKYEMLQHFC